MFALKPHTFRSWQIPEFRLYFIDYGSSRQMSSGPGCGAVIQDYTTMGGHHPPPEGSDNLDPYAFNIFKFSLGYTFKSALLVSNCNALFLNQLSIPHRRHDSLDRLTQFGPSLQSFIDILTDAAPIRRPPIKTVIHLWHALVSWNSAMEGIDVANLAQRCATTLSPSATIQI